MRIDFGGKLFYFDTSFTLSVNCTYLAFYLLHRIPHMFQYFHKYNLCSSNAKESQVTNIQYYLSRSMLMKFVAWQLILLQSF